MNVLVVEDDPGVLEGLTEILGEVAPVRTATTVDRALVEIAQGGVGLVVTDLHFGEGSGTRIVEGAQAKGLPVIVCTGSSRFEVPALLGGLRPEGILTKPFSIDEVLAMANRLLKK